MYVCAAVLCEVISKAQETDKHTEKVTKDELQQSVIHQEAETESKQKKIVFPMMVMRSFGGLTAAAVCLYCCCCMFVLLLLLLLSV